MPGLGCFVLLWLHFFHISFFSSGKLGWIQISRCGRCSSFLTDGVGGRVTYMDATGVGQAMGPHRSVRESLTRGRIAIALVVDDDFLVPKRGEIVPLLF